MDLKNMILRLFGKPQASTYANPAKWFVDWIRSEESDSGERINQETAMHISAYWAGVRLISEAIASLPVHVYRRRNGRGKDRITTHPVYWLLHDQPNSEMTAFSFRETLAYYVINWGNAYAEIQRRYDGMPQALWPLPPSQVKPERMDDGKIWYEYTPIDGRPKTYLNSADVLHIPGLSFDGINGYSVLQVARQDLGLTKAQDRYGAKFFANGAHLSGTLNTDVPLGDEAYERTKKEWNAKHEGLDNAHRTAILDNGLRFTPIGIPNTDAQWLESRKFQIQQVARWLNIPPHKLRELSNATFSNIEHQNIEWVTDTLRPWLIRFEQEYKRKLFRDRSLYVEHEINGLLRGDAATRKEMYQAGRQWGWLSANDIRELENMNPIADGDIYLSPANMVDASKMDEPQEPPQTQQQTEPQTDQQTNPQEETDMESVIHGIVWNEGGMIRRAMKNTKTCESRLLSFYQHEFRESLKNKFHLDDEKINHYSDESIRNAYSGEYKSPQWIEKRMGALFEMIAN